MLPPPAAPKGCHHPFARGGGTASLWNRQGAHRAPGCAQHRPCGPALAPSPIWLSVPRLLFPKCHSYHVTPCPSILEGFPLPKCIHLQHLLEISASISCPPHKADPLFRPLGTLQTHFDPALPCSNRLPTAGQADVTCSDLSGLSCLSLPPPPPAQPYGFHVAIRLLQVR